MYFRNEAEIQCFLYANFEKVKVLLKQIIDEMYGTNIDKETIEYVGVEYCIPVSCTSKWARGRERIDILYQMNDVFIPIELKQYAGPDSFYQVHSYKNGLKDFFGRESICGVIANKLSKNAKQTIQGHQNYFWVELSTLTYGV